MSLPKVIADLVTAQDNHDSVAYANCFLETGVMFDKGKTHTGRREIQHWMAQGNEKYRTIMEPVAFTETGSTSVLSAKVSGTFDGSPIVLKFHFEIINGLIQSLEVTG